MGNFSQSYIDNFDNATVDLGVYDPTSGASLSEPAGTRIILSNPSGNRLRNIPFFYEHLGAYEQADTIPALASAYTGLARYTWKLSAVNNIVNVDGSRFFYTGAALGLNDTGTGPITDQSRKVSLWLGYNGVVWRIGATRHISTSTQSDYNQIVTIADPSNLNLLFRAYWNKTERYMILPEDGSIIGNATGGGDLAYYYSLDGGSNWVLMALNPGGTTSFPDTPGVEVFTESNSPYAGFDAEWDYITIEEDDGLSLGSGPASTGRKLVAFSRKRDSSSANRTDTVAILEGSTWNAFNPDAGLPTNLNYTALWGNGTELNNVVAGGESINVQHYETDTWNTRSIGTLDDIEQIHGQAQDDIWAVSGDKLFYWNGVSWTNEIITGVSGNHIATALLSTPQGTAWMATDDRLFQKPVSASIVEHTAALATAGLDNSIAIWGTSDTNIYVGGSTTAGRTRIAKWNGASWSIVYTNDTATYNKIVAVWGTDDSNIWAVMNNQPDGGLAYHRVLYWNGTSWAEQQIAKVSASFAANPQAIHGIGTGANEIVITGAGDQNGVTSLTFGAAIWHYNGDTTWSRQTVYDLDYDWFQVSDMIFVETVIPPDKGAKKGYALPYGSQFGRDIFRTGPSTPTAEAKGPFLYRFGERQGRSTNESGVEATDRDYAFVIGNSLAESFDMSIGDYMDIYQDITFDTINSLTFDMTALQPADMPAPRTVANCTLKRGEVAFSAPALVETPDTGPYALADAMTLDIDVDGTGAQTITFNAANFNNIAQATAQEVTDAIVDGLTSGTSTTNEGATKVRVLSTSAGIASTVQVTGGTANAVLNFSTTLKTGGDDLSALVAPTDAFTVADIGRSVTFVGTVGNDITTRIIGAVSEHVNKLTDVTSDLGQTTVLLENQITAEVAGFTTTINGALWEISIWLEDELQLQRVFERAEEIVSSDFRINTSKATGVVRVTFRLTLIAEV